MKKSLGAEVPIHHSYISRRKRDPQLNPGIYLI